MIRNFLKKLETGLKILYLILLIEVIVLLIMFYDYSKIILESIIKEVMK